MFTVYNIYNKFDKFLEDDPPPSKPIIDQLKEFKDNVGKRFERKKDDPSPQPSGRPPQPI
jgi:hypothetical protein